MSTKVVSMERRALAWMLSGDSGVSSETMLSIALGITKKDSCGFDVPYDAGDFGRCYRLVEQVPEIRDKFEAIGRRFVAFKPILACWDELAAIYEQDLPTGKSARLGERLRELRKTPLRK